MNFLYNVHLCYSFSSNFCESCYWVIKSKVTYLHMCMVYKIHCTLQKLIHTNITVEKLVIWIPLLCPNDYKNLARHLTMPDLVWHMSPINLAPKHCTGETGSQAQVSGWYCGEQTKPWWITTKYGFLLYANFFFCHLLIIYMRSISSLKRGFFLWIKEYQTELYLSFLISNLFGNCSPRYILFGTSQLKPENPSKHLHR